MSVPVVVLDDPALLPAELPGLRICTTADFLRGADGLTAGARVINLASARGYLEAGWYVSLLAEARGGGDPSLKPHCWSSLGTGDPRNGPFVSKVWTCWTPKRWRPDCGWLPRWRPSS